MKVALVGSAPSSRMLAPYNDPSWQIWACSPDNAGQLPRVDLWFELHGDLGWPEYQHWAKPYTAWLNEQGFPIFAQDRTHIKRALIFPYQDMMRKFGKYFFTSSFAWMIALAISKGATEIGLFGIDMATDDEYAKQRPGFQHFLTLAQHLGVKVAAPQESDILQPPPLYGYSITTDFGRKVHVRKKELAERIELISKQIGELNRQRDHLAGALDNMDYIETVWTGHQDHAEDARHTEILRDVSPRRNGAFAEDHFPNIEGLSTHG